MRVVSDQSLFAEIIDRDDFTLSETMIGRNDNYQRVGHHRQRFHRRIVRRERNDPYLDVTRGDLARNTARNPAPHFYFYLRMLLAKLSDHRQQVKHGMLIGTDRDLALLKLSEVSQRTFCGIA